jgi:hypothetical protein
MSSIKQTIWLDNCNVDVIERLRTIFQYDTLGVSEFADTFHVLNTLYGKDFSEVDFPPQLWLDENVGVNTFSGRIEEININTATVRLLIVSEELATLLVKNLLAELTYRNPEIMKFDVYLSGIYNSILHEQAGVMVGKLNEEEIVLNYTAKDMSSFDLTSLNDADPTDLEDLGQSLEDLKTVKYLEFLNL